MNFHIEQKFYFALQYNLVVSGQRGEVHREPLVCGVINDFASWSLYSGGPKGQTGVDQWSHQQS